MRRTTCAPARLVHVLFAILLIPLAVVAATPARATPAERPAAASTSSLASTEAAFYAALNGRFR